MIENKTVVPRAFQGFAHLRKCDLRAIISQTRDASKWLQGLVSRCPVLEHLIIHLTLSPKDECKDFTLSSDSLVRLDVELRVEHPMQINIIAPQLCKLGLTCYCEGTSRVTIEAPHLLEMSLSKGKHVTLGGPHPPTIFFQTLQKLEVTLEPHDNMPEWLDDFLSNCPNLQHLSLVLRFFKPNYCHSDSEEDEEDMNLTFSSQSLSSLYIQLINPHCRFHITLVALELLKLKIDVRYKRSDTGHMVRVKVEAPKLLELKVPEENRYVALDLSKFGFYKLLTRRIVNVKWNTTDHHLTALQLNDNFLSSSHGRIIRLLDTISKLLSLKHLALSKIQACPNDIWNHLLIHLPSLEMLSFSNCIFKDKDETVNTCAVKSKMAKLKEIHFAKETEDFLDGEKEMLSILSQNTPNLQILKYTLKNKCQHKDKCMVLLGQMLLSGDLLTLNEFSEKIQFKILKRNAKYKKELLSLMY